MRVLPDVSGLAKEFDYLANPSQARSIEIGSIVRFDLNGRRVAGWVTEVEPEPTGRFRLQPLSRVSSLGPTADTVDLARWAAHRWHGRLSAILKVASPPRNVAGLPAEPPAGQPTGPTAPVGAEVVVARIPPTADPADYIASLTGEGDVLVITGLLSDAGRLAGRLSRAGWATRLHPDDWAAAAGRGGIVIGARSAVWARVRRLGAVVVLDEHDESHQEERNPTWNAREVAIERAARAGVTCHLLSACPSAVALVGAGRLVEPSRAAERAAWPIVEIVDRRSEEPGRSGLFSPRVADLVRRPGRVLAVLNRKGRSVMSACATCGELARTLDGERLMVERDGRLVCPPTGEERPLVCAVCGGTTLRRLRLGVTRAAEELAALAGEPVDEWSGPQDRGRPSPTRVVVGTEAALHGLSHSDTVVFLDFDNELLAPRYRAGEQAMTLLIRAARLVGPRGAGGRVVVQTRSPEHRVLEAAVRADPARFGRAEVELRRQLGLPPFGALAEVSGAGAGALVSGLSGEVAVMGPNADGRYLIRAADHDVLADALAEADAEADPGRRGRRTRSSRTRVAVDPPRV